MKSDVGRLMFGAYLASDILANVAKKKWSGGYELRGLDFMIASIWVFQKGAILGRAKFDHIKTLAKLITVKEGEEDLCDFFRSATERLLTAYGKEPNYFPDFILKTIFPEIDISNIGTLKALHNKKYRLEKLSSQFQIYVATGTGFGALNPELVQKMWVNSYEKDRYPDVWEQARLHGLNVPEKLSYSPLAEMEELVLAEVSEFVSKYHPNLVEPLGLGIQSK